jgi:hypothetical protein
MEETVPFSKLFEIPRLQRGIHGENSATSVSFSFVLLSIIPEDRKEKRILFP